MCRWLILVIVIVTAAWLVAAADGMWEISLADLHDKIEGGWASQMIGASFGAYMARSPRMSTKRHYATGVA
jgi:hypothetical protein